MIEINLLDQVLKTKGRKSALGFLPKKKLKQLIPWGFAALVCLHILLIVLNVRKIYQLRILTDKWHSLEPQRKELESFKKKYGVLSADTNKIQQLTNQRICRAQELNKLSLDLPSGVWLTEVSLTQNSFVLNGAAVSLKKEELVLINGFLDKLKNDPVFFKDFKNLELSSVQRKSVGGYEIVNFVFSGTLK